MKRSRSEYDISEYILSKFTIGAPSCLGIKQLAWRYQSLAIIVLNISFISIMILWKLISVLITHLPGDEVIFPLVPIHIVSLALMKKGRKDLAAFVLLMSFHAGNHIASKVCNLVLGASYFVTIVPGLTYFVSSSKKVHFISMILCILQNIGHIYRINKIFKVTFTEDQQFQIFTCGVVSFMYIPVNWMFFIIQKSIENQLWQVAHSNYEKAENITKELIEAVESKDRVVSSFSHEIRNPLNSLNGSIDYLLKVIKDQDHLKVLKNARLSGEVLLNLVNNILDAAKLKSEKMEIACTETNPVNVIKKVLNINAEIITQKKIKAKAYVDKLLPSRLYIDSSRLLQVIMNLFSNATKFVPEGGKIDIFMQWCGEETSREELLLPFLANNPDADTSKEQIDECSELDFSIPRRDRLTHSSIKNLIYDTEEFQTSEVLKHSKNLSYLQKVLKKNKLNDLKPQNIWIMEKFETMDLDGPAISQKTQTSLHNIKSNPHKGFLKVQISDSGCGISPQNIPKLFSMFSQVESRNAHGGTGLGLWICKQLCQKMGGDITISSKVNFGTSIVFYIAVNNHALSSSIGAPNVASRQMHSEKVRALVVDDFAYNRDVHKLILEREGVEVSLACNGKEAVEKYMSQNDGFFSFIMMDIQMPIMDGITAAQLIRKFESENQRKEIDIYFVSGNYYSKTEALGSVNSIGYHSDLMNTQFLRKPIDVEIVKKISDKYNALLKKNI